jgi:hypothetical protein
VSSLCDERLDPGGTGSSLGPAPLPGDVIDWIETFAQSFLQRLPAVARAEYLQEVRAVLEPQLRDSTGTWVADYVRLRFAATKVDAAAAVR